MRTLRSRLILSHILPILIVVPLIAILGYAILATQGRLASMESALDHQARQLTDQATTLAQAADAQDDIWSNPETARRFVTGVDMQISTIMLLDAQGQVLASSAPSDANSPGAATDAQDLSAILGGQTSVRLRYVELGGAPAASVYVPVMDANRQLSGIVFLSQEIADIQSRVGRIYLLLLATVIVLLILGVALGSYLALRLENSLRAVTDSLHGIAVGQPPSLLPQQRTVEIDLLYQAVNTLVQRLQTMEDARRRLLANLVHELGRPLGSLRSAIFALKQGASDDPALRDELLQGMDAQIVRMEPLLDDLTRLHGQVLGRLELNRQPVALAGWLHDQQTLWREQARQKGVAWQTDIPLSLPTVQIDVDQMGRALGNLLSNAVKFTPAGGTIRVSAGVRPASDPGAADQAWVAIQDNGPGIPPQEQARIFEPFHRGVGDRRFPQGMGLGLTIARDLARAHGGDIELQSEAGAGSTFTLTFPVEPVLHHP